MSRAYGGHGEWPSTPLGIDRYRPTIEEGFTSISHPRRPDGCSGPFRPWLERPGSTPAERG
ncbi:hypothetical protein MINT15_38540 [Saccharomonospora viridis]|uniref:Uncharacterized protein n=1 Tax=Saccharomonospora viridis TaxID=1852 RepID=A0A837D3S5_9PSEU|nr:hypothetical protein MINT15_38540 [Saccharomonospora viridis]